MKPNPKEAHKQHTFDAYCKRILKNESSDYHRRMNVWALYIRKTSKRNCFRLGGQPAAPVTIGELSSIYSAIRRNSSAYLNFTLILPPS